VLTWFCLRDEGHFERFYKAEDLFFYDPINIKKQQEIENTWHEYISKSIDNERR